jgi:hypothetical protein
MKKVYLAVAVCSALALSACGGSGENAESAEVAHGPVTLHGKVEMCDAAPQSKARVILPYGEDQSYEATTDADGSFALTVDSANLDGVSPVALAVFDEADSCQPAEIFVDSAAEGVRTGRIDIPPKKLNDLRPAEFVMSARARPLIHLGDDKYGGPANSRLQVASHGITVSNLVGTITQEFKDSYSTAYIEFSARGMQQESQQCATQYENQLVLSATGPGAGAPIVKTVRPDASSATGEFTRYSIPIDLADFPADSSISFVASSGQCASGGTDYDDFELSNVLVRFVQ